MAVVAQIPTHSTIYPDVGTIQAGFATAFRTTLNNYLGSVENKAQLTQAYVEQNHAHAGFGGVGGGAMTAGVGLSVLVAAATAFVGNYVATDATGTVGLTASAVNYIYFRQAGLFTASTATTVPGTADGFGTACLWGSVTTTGGTTTVIDNARPIYQSPGHMATITLTGGTFSGGMGTVSLNQATNRRLIVSGGSAFGTAPLTFPHVAGAGSWAEWEVYNNGSVLLDCAGSIGATVQIPPGQSVTIGSNGTALVAVTPIDGIINANNQTGTSYTLALSDLGKVVELNNAAAITLTIPHGTVISFPLGAVVELFQQGAGTVTVTPASGVTLRSNGSRTKLSAQYASASVRQRAYNEWVLSGDITS